MTAAAAAATRVNEDKAPKDGESALYSDEYYAAQKAKRQGLGLIKFIGELFKLQPNSSLPRTTDRHPPLTAGSTM